MKKNKKNFIYYYNLTVKIENIFQRYPYTSCDLLTIFNGNFFLLLFLTLNIGDQKNQLYNQGIFKMNK